MALNFADRCWFVAGNGGTTDFGDGTAQAGFRNLEDSLLTGGDTYGYIAESLDHTQWEVGVGTYAVSPHTLQRTTVVKSSNGDAKVNFSEAPFVFLTPVASNIADFLKYNIFARLTAGFTEGITDDGTKSTGTYTPTPESGTLTKRIINGGAFTLAPYSPPNDTMVRMTVIVTNNGSAGAITTTGWDHVVGEFDTTNGNVFLCDIEIRDVGGTETSTLTIRAQQ